MSSETFGEDHLAVALAAALLDYQRRREGETVTDSRVSRWKMLGRWELMRGWGQ